MRKTLTPKTKLFVEKFNLQSILPPMTLSFLRFIHSEAHPLSQGGSYLNANRPVLWEDLGEPDSSPCEWCEHPLFWTTENPTINELVTQFKDHSKTLASNFRVCIHHNNNDEEDFNQGNLSVICKWCSSLLNWTPYSNTFKQDCLEALSFTPPFIRPLLPNPQDWLIHEALSIPHRPWPSPPVPPPPSDPDWLVHVLKMKTAIKLTPHMLAFLNHNPKEIAQNP